MPRTGSTESILFSPGVVFMLCLVCAIGCRRGGLPVPPVPADEAPISPIQLTDVTARTGIAFEHTDGSSGRYYIIEPMSAGLATFDFDGDGLIDIYFLNGAPLQGAQVDHPPRNALYRNLGDWRFVEVTDPTRVGDEGFGLGVTVGDFDNDGFPDLFVNNFGPNVLYRNNGDGTFTDVTEQAGVAGEGQVGAGAAFLDIDSNGLLDLYVGNYLEFSYDIHVQRWVDGLPAYPLPRDYDPVPDTLYRNNGDGTFTDTSEQSGIAQYSGRTMGLIAADYNDDGHTDVFVANDVMANFFFENDGTGRFQEVAIQNGTAYNFYGGANANMGVDCGDYDNDGLLDFFVTSYQGEMPVLYRNLGDGLLEDVTQRANAGDGMFVHVNWGTGLIDFDNDGFRDLFIANGHTEDNIELRVPGAAYRAPNSLLRNQGDGTFLNVRESSGDGLLPVHASRGTAFDDLDNNGRIDAVILNSRQHPTILRNDSPGGNPWVQLRLVGVRANRDAVGSRVTVVAGDLVQTAEVHSGRSYQSHYGSRLHFGLVRNSRIDRIEIRWHGGDTQILENPPTDQFHTLIEPHR